MADSEEESLKKLRESEEKFSKAFQTSPYAITITDLKTGRFVEVNDAFVSFSGYTKEEALVNTSIGLNLWFDPKDREQMVSALMRGEDVRDREFKFRMKNGDVLTGLYSARVMQVGGTPHIFSSINDITEKKVLEHEFKVSELRYRRLFESAKDGILIVDFESGTILDVNQFLIDKLEYTKEEILNKHLWEVGSFKDVIASREKFEELKSRDYVRYEDLPVEAKWGKRIPVEFISNVYEVGGVKTIQCNVRDITERKDAENELSEGRARLEAVLEGIAEGVFVVDDLGKIILFNRMAAKITGYGVSDVLAKNYWEILHFTPEGLEPRERDFIRDSLSGKKMVEESSIILNRSDGVKFSVEASAAPVFSKGGESLGVVVVFRNVTAQREAERIRDEFMMIASHELRAPMTAIKWLVSMILDGSYGVVNDYLKVPLASIETSTERLIHLVNDMISVTRIEGKNLKFVLTDFDIKKLIDHILVSFGPEAASRGITLKSDIMSEATIQADTDRLEQALANLVDNAIKFNNDGGEISMGVEKNGDYLEIKVADTGVGIATDFRDKLFTKFGQILTKKEGRPMGTGLGLFISRELARDMGGDLWLAASEVGKGSTFVLKIPLSSTAAASKALANLNNKK